MVPSGNRAGTRRGCESIGGCGIKAVRKHRGDVERRRSRVEPDAGARAKAPVEAKDPPDGRNRRRWARASGRSAEGSSRRKKPKVADAAQAKAEADGSLGKPHPARLYGSASGRGHEAGRRWPERKPVSPDMGGSAGLGDRREARMPLPARVEHAAETRPRVLRDERLKSGDMGTGSNAGPLLRS